MGYQLMVFTQFLNKMDILLKALRKAYYILLTATSFRDHRKVMMNSMRVEFQIKKKDMQTKKYNTVLFKTDHIRTINKHPNSSSLKLCNELTQKDTSIMASLKKMIQKSIIHLEKDRQCSIQELVILNLLDNSNLLSGVETSLYKKISDLSQKSNRKYNQIFQKK